MYSIYTDHINLPKGATTPDLRISVSSELMKNSKKAFPINFSAKAPQLKMAHDSNGEPIIFSIGTDQQLHLITHASGTADGWEVAEIKEVLEMTIQVQDFDVSQASNGQLSVALLSASEQKVYLASGISNAVGMDWSSVEWQQVQFDDEGFSPKSLLVGSAEEQDVAALTVVGMLNDVYCYAEVLDGQNGKVIAFDEDIRVEDQLPKIAMGHYIGERARFMQYTIGKHTNKIELSVPSGISVFFDADSYGMKPFNCYATAVNPNDPDNIFSDLYVATDDGIFLFPYGDNSGDYKVPVTDELKDVHEMEVHSDGKAISIWVTSGNTVYYMAGTTDGDSYFFPFPPIKYADGVVHLAPICANVNKRNELLLVKNDGQLEHHWQDNQEDSQLWHHDTIKLEAADYVIQYNSYTTHIKLKDQYGQPYGTGGQANERPRVRITASEWQYVAINGLVYSLDKDVPADVPLDEMGNLTVIMPASSAACSVLHVEADFFDGTLNVYPNGKVLKGLNGVQKGEDLKNAKTPEGEPVVDPTTKKEDLDGVASGTHQIHQQTQHLQDKLAGNTYAVWDDKKHTGLFWQDYPSLYSNRLTHEDDNSIWSSVGDFFHKAKELLEEGLDEIKREGKKLTIALKSGAQFIVNEVESEIHFIIQIGEKAFKLVLDAIHKVMKAIESVLLTILKKVLEKLLVWLGHFFNWKDIWRTHEGIATIADNAIEYGRDQIVSKMEEAKDTLTHFFNRMEQNLDTWLEHIKQETGNQQFSQQQQQTSQKSIDHSKQNHVNHPGTNWSFYHVQHGVLPNAKSLALTFERPSNDDDIEAILKKAAQDITTDLEKVMDDFKTLFQKLESATTYDVMKLVVDTGK
ncbi:MAG: hypothetical protein AAF798_14075, partial [Bacteroidota bacterium]